MKLNITPATSIPTDAPRVTLTMTAAHAALYAEMVEKTAVQGRSARILADLYDMAQEANAFFKGGNVVQALPAEEDDA